MVLDALH